MPWTHEGKPCLLSADEGGGGYLSQLADGLEAVQLAMGNDVLAHARKLLDDPTSPNAEVRYAAIRLAECLSDALRVAESRGMRLDDSDSDSPSEASA
ncbi:hypothetical protein G5C60_03465 [Streptomyces sp. HC44]|uniref:Uncharacterized protein n=1 Tax=Streptomyces scabichelini TaxID=2711217 RepID=A0A6G4UYE2_9ACTN|nr:hypothetical protein [Streptomyces scabichelini]